MWMKGGNNKVHYLGIQDQCYTWTMFDAQALWALKSIMGDIKTPPREEMLKDIQEWIKR
jgi:trimethylamine monooxygenase